MPDLLDAKFAALADPTRRALLSRLALGDATLTDLAKPFAVTVPAIAKHLGVLERAGLVRRGQRSSARPVSLQADAMADMTDWIADCRRHWAGSLDRLAAYLAATETDRDAAS